MDLNQSYSTPTSFVQPEKNHAKTALKDLLLSRESPAKVESRESKKSHSARDRVPFFALNIKPIRLIGKLVSSFLKVMIINSK